LRDNRWYIEGETFEKMAMLMAFPTMEGNVLILYGLISIRIVVRQKNRVREGLKNIHIYTNVSVGCITTLFCGFRGIDKVS
jgi:hypothetical protein